MEIITTHSNTDFDALASVIAATILYPDAIPVLHKSVNPNVKDFLSLHKEIFKIHSSKEINIDKIKKVIVVDTNNWSRLSKIGNLKEKEDIEIDLWDHHKGGDIIPNGTFCKEEKGACITLLVRELKKQNKQISPFQATLFLMGLYEDTGNLTFTSTTPEDAYTAAFLLENNADLNILTTFIKQAYGKEQKEALFEMLSKSEKIYMAGSDVSFAKIDISGHVEGLSVVLNMYREIIDADVVFGIFKDVKKNKCIVIGRSKSDEINIGSILKKFGGGGHPGAGSAMIKDVESDQVEKMITENILSKSSSSVDLKDLITEPETISPNTSMQDFAKLLRDRGSTGFTVMEDNKIVGVISIFDFKRVRKQSQMNSPVKAFMTKDIISIDQTSTPSEAAKIMIKNDIGRLPVIENDVLIGVISRTTAMKYYYETID
ncbi:MAG: CBS domain-containing protein [Desulfobacterales bacterium]|nr:CBS domain-containing protein [Desulfobacterales bacterium]